MDETISSVNVGERLIKLGLINEYQLQDAKVEAKESNPEPLVLLGVLERRGILTPWQSNKVLKGDASGFFLGGYRVLYKISSGSFGRVYRAEEPNAGSIVAIKVLRRRWSEDQERIDLFSREAKVGLTLKHENIVEIHAMNRDQASGQYYIVMEFVEGGNLRELLKSRKVLGVSEALKLIEDAAAGLTYAYSKGVTHRDMKLTNILVSSQGTAKLVDFGLATIYSGLVEEKQSKDKEKIERTVDYAGLERASGVKSGDVRSDIYFLGAVLYECLTGRSPLEKVTDKHARMQKSRFDNVVPIRRDEVEAPASLFHLVETMMALDPYLRYQTPSQLLEAIRGVRREVEGGVTDGAAAAVAKPARSLFIVESDTRLQEALRDKFKELGYRVFLAADPMRALDRFRQQPYDGLIVDVGPTNQDALFLFNNVMSMAAQKHYPLCGVLILNEEQSRWAARVDARPRSAVMIRPITLKKLYRKLQELEAHTDVKPEDNSTDDTKVG